MWVEGLSNGKKHVSLPSRIRAMNFMQKEREKNISADARRRLLHVNSPKLNFPFELRRAYRLKLQSVLIFLFTNVCFRPLPRNGTKSFYAFDSILKGVSEGKEHHRMLLTVKVPMNI